VKQSPCFLVVRIFEQQRGHIMGMELSVAESEWRFALKIGVFNTLAFCLLAGGETYIAGIFHEANPFWKREHPLGYWVLLCALPVFGLSWLLLRKPTFVRALSCFFLSLLIGVTVTVFNVKPAFQLWVAPFGGYALLFAPGLIAGPIHKARTTRIVAQRIQDKQSYVEWLKQSADFWKTAALSGVFASMAAALPVMQYILERASTDVRDPHDQRIVAIYLLTQLWFVVSYVFFGPILGLFQRAKEATDGILDVAIGGGTARNSQK